MDHVLARVVQIILDAAAHAAEGLGAPAERIDFSAERTRREPVFGREDVLAAIEQALAGPPGAAGWVLLTRADSLASSVLDNANALGGWHPDRMDRMPEGPRDRATTVREALVHALRGPPCTARALSAAVGISEKDVAAHLAHLECSLRGRGEELRTTPASCLACGFVFRKRERLTRPGACPQCRGTRIDPPAFHIVPC